MTEGFYFKRGYSDFMLKIDFELSHQITINEIQSILALNNIKYYDIITHEHTGVNKLVYVSVHGGVRLPKSGFYTIIA